MTRLAFAVLLATGAFAADQAPTNGRIFFLDIRGGRVVSASPDGSEFKVLVDGHKRGPDGIVVDGNHVFWTNMGRVSLDDGSIERVDLDGKNLTVIVPEGGTFTPKQLKLDKKHGKLYWSDREGMRVMRANLDGSHIETLVETGRGDEDRKDQSRWCVGIALDVEHGKMYWTQKGGDNAGKGMLLRANMEIPKGQDPARRTDIETLFSGLPEPIDVDLDLTHRMIYWTDRGNPPRGNTVNRAPMDKKVSEPEVLVSGLNEGIGIALDVKGGRMFFTDLGGTVYSANLDGSNKKVLLSGQGTLTGIAYAEVR